MFASHLFRMYGSDTAAPNGWINPAAFVAAPQDRWGTSGAGYVEGPGMQIYDLSLTEFFALLENIRIRVRAYPPRNVQLGLQLEF